MTFDEFMELVLKDFPNAHVGEDSDGQLVIYTNLKETLDGSEIRDIDTGDLYL